MHPHLAIYFGSPYGRYPTFHTLTNVGRKKLSVCYKNESFKMGIFPDIRKIARVTSIFKSGSKSDKGNYRLISVLSIFSRLQEKLGHDQVSNCMKEQAKEIRYMSTCIFKNA